MAVPVMSFVKDTKIGREVIIPFQGCNLTKACSAGKSHLFKLHPYLLETTETQTEPYSLGNLQCHLPIYIYKEVCAIP